MVSFLLPAVKDTITYASPPSGRRESGFPATNDVTNFVYILVGYSNKKNISLVRV